MSSAASLQSELSGRLDEQAHQFDALAVISTLPFGVFYANFLFWRLIREHRKAMHSQRDILLDEDFILCPLEDRRRWVATYSRHVNFFRQELPKIESLASRGILFRPLVTRWANSIDEDSDFAETLALGMDPEIESLTKELSDVL